jgi:dTDP-4-dehydrorhamnose reductase
VYGASKADGGLAVLRTSWVYGPVGRNFCSRCCACLAVLEHAVAGVHHWSDAGAASWYEFDLAVTTVLREPPG